MKNGAIIVLLLVLIAGGIYFIEVNRNSQNTEYALKSDTSNGGSEKSDTSNGGFDNSEIIRQVVRETKAKLPTKVDVMTTFTDVIGGKDSLTYLYEVDMDLSHITPMQREVIKEQFPKFVCHQMLPLVCRTGKDFFDRGIVVNTKYYLKDGSTLVECHYSHAECARLTAK